MKKIALLVCAGALAAGMLAFGAACSQAQQGGGGNGSAGGDPGSSRQESTEQAPAGEGAEDAAVPELAFEGNELKVMLEGNATTGYTWVPSIEGAALALTGTDYLMDESEEGTVGAGGTFVFVFQGQGAGTSTIDFLYTQAWDPKDDDRKAAVEVETAADGTIEGAQIKA